MLGHDLVGTGSTRVIVLNDWLCDTSTWDSARPYFDLARCTWAFADLRGYGRSRGQTGAFDVREGAADVTALADALGWAQFAIVGHSMSTLVAIELAQHAADRITRVALLTPPPPGGFGGNPAMIAGSQALALGDDAARAAFFATRSSQHLSPGWSAFKAKRWRETSDPAAAAAYVLMFGRDGVTDPRARIAAPVLAITGERDAEPMRAAGVTAALSPLCERLEVVALADVGHYPMQEMPAFAVATLERFLS